jgi:hypothetical protein
MDGNVDTVWDKTKSTYGFVLSVFLLTLRNTILQVKIFDGLSSKIIIKLFICG